MIEEMCGVCCWSTEGLTAPPALLFNLQDKTVTNEGLSQVWLGVLYVTLTPCAATPQAKAINNGACSHFPLFHVLAAVAALCSALCNFLTARNFLEQSVGVFPFDLCLMKQLLLVEQPGVTSARLEGYEIVRNTWRRNDIRCTMH